MAPTLPPPPSLPPHLPSLPPEVEAFALTLPSLPGAAPIGSPCPNPLCGGVMKWTSTGFLIDNDNDNCPNIIYSYGCSKGCVYLGCKHIPFSDITPQ
jgi:hypothetical protein